MPTIFQSLILGLIQGATELFPVSSLGHAVIIPGLLHWQLDQNNEMFLIFLVATHLATALVLVAFYFRDWVCIIRGLVLSFSGSRRDDVYTRLGWLLIYGTIPAGIVGLMFEHKIKTWLASPMLVAVVLILNGIMLIGMEAYRRRRAGAHEESAARQDAAISHMSYFNAFKVGLAQCLALIPGFSRTGAALGGGLSVGLNHEEAARFSFLLATPIIFAASVLKLPQLVHAADTSYLLPMLVGFVTAGIAAYVSVRYLTNYFKTNNLNRFGAYCIIIGVVALMFIR